MALKITCPHCGSPHRLQEPYPLPGSELHCEGCGKTLSLTYPPGLVQKLRQRGARFERPPAAGAPPPKAPPEGAPSPGRLTRRPAPARSESSRSRQSPDHSAPHRPASGRPPPAAPRPLEPTERMVGGAPRGYRQPASPHAALPRDATGPTVHAPITASPPPARSPARASGWTASRPGPPAGGERPTRDLGGRRARAKRSWLGRIFLWLLLLGFIGGLAGVGTLVGAFWYYGRDLPTVESLGRYRPPTVTVVYDHQGRLLGEIYQKRRYVVPLDKIPTDVINAFVAAEDADFWKHQGIDITGIFRAVARDLLTGRKAQGASTITMQVARNFLLTNQKTFQRKIREMLLARRIEQTFDKNHILYLYLNQIYLGSGAYGVEAASRAYFGKHVEDLSLAEAAILAGLPQRPSDYSPHRHWKKARARQEYVLKRMLADGYIDKARYDEAMAEPVTIVKNRNEFLEQAPWFTEHIRRYLVETYGSDKVYNDGLVVHSTCDLELQKVAQKAVVDGVTKADERIGWRGPTSHLDEAKIAPHLALQDKKLREEVARSTLRVADPNSGKGGYGAVPARSVLVQGRHYEAVVLKVAQKYAVVGIGKHQALIPLSWTTWAYKPNPERSWKWRHQTDMRNVVKRGDVVQVTIAGLSTDDFKELKGYADAGPGPFAAARLYQKPELEGALFSYRHKDGAVLAMVGGVDFEDSQYNRAIQARRQVGSTFKPIVYTAAIASEKFTVGTLVPDAPLALPTLGSKLWKPSNYGNDYLGDITVRRALQLSKNVCTVRILDRLGLDPVYELAGPTLRIGYPTPRCHRVLIEDDMTCQGDKSPSPVKGKSWCEWCDAESCPLVRATRPTLYENGEKVSVGDPKTCMDEPHQIDGETWCHSCDVNLRVCDWLPKERIPSTDPCVDERLDDQGRKLCRSCDLSMGLGSSSLTMVELARAYSVFATYGHLVQPHFIDEVVDRDGTVIERWEPPEAGWPLVLNPSVAAIGHWLLRQVATGGTAARSNRLGLHLAGKTGTTNDFIDAWFVGYNPEILTATWVGFDQPRSMGVSFTGGQTALPIWMDYMKVACPKDKDHAFPPLPGVEFVPIDESTGRVAQGGRMMPMLPGTAPRNLVGKVGQKAAEDLLTSGF